MIDEDELVRGQRREGVFYSGFLFIQKVGLSVGLALSGFALEAAGYLTPETAGAAVEQPAAVLLGLRLLVGAAPVASLLIGTLCAWRYPITRARYRAIEGGLAARAAAP